jgi:hypothetical protein
MRFAIKLAGPCLAATLAASASASAQTLQKKSVGTFSSGWTIVTPGYVFRADPKSSPRAPRPTAVLPLTAGECTRLGGKVSIFGICKSGKVCTREDENGKKHQVCVSKS